MAKVTRDEVVTWAGRLRRVLGRKDAAGSIGGGVKPPHLAEWLRVRGYNHIEDRVHDAGWAFVVSTKADRYFADGATPPSYDDHGLVVVKRTGEVWAPNTSLSQLWHWVCSDETTFEAWMAAEFPHLRPNERVEF